MQFNVLFSESSVQVVDDFKVQPTGGWLTYPNGMRRPAVTWSLPHVKGVYRGLLAHPGDDGMIVVSAICGRWFSFRLFGNGMGEVVELSSKNPQIVTLVDAIRRTSPTLRNRLDQALRPAR